jgi:hypothetical protein
MIIKIMIRLKCEAKIAASKANEAWGLYHIFITPLGWFCHPKHASLIAAPKDLKFEHGAHIPQGGF